VNSVALHSLKVWTAIFFAGIATASESPTPGPAKALAAAREDFEAIQQFSTTSLDLTAPVMLRRNLAPLETTSGNGRELSPIQRARRSAIDKAARRTVPSKTWLVDAMRDDTETKLPRSGDVTTLDSSGDGGARPREDELFPRWGDLGKTARGTHNARSDQSPEKPSSIVIQNPLDGYMAKWMTGRDFDLLRSNSQPAEQGISSAIHPSRNSYFEGVPSSGLNVTLPVRLRSEFDVPPQSRATKENPYLEGAVQVPPQIPKQAAPADAQPDLAPLLQPRSPIVERTDPVQAQQSMNELLKPREDARYFKQLKRF
jgi:hypothetical protein